MRISSGGQRSVVAARMLLPLLLAVCLETASTRRASAQLATEQPSSIIASATPVAPRFADLETSSRALSTTATTAASVKGPLVASILPNFYDPDDGTSFGELLRRALAANLELAAARLEIDKARARLAQARLRPNPSLEVETTSGRVVGNAGDYGFGVGATLPIEIYGRRDARVNLAEIAIEASESDVRNRERILTASILSCYADALAGLREIELVEQVLELETQTARFVQIRVNEGDAPPLELNLLQAEIERLRSRRQLAEGRLASALIGLKSLAGIDFAEPLRLREKIATADLGALPPTREDAVATAFRSRPDVAFARIEERASAAGLALVRAQARPDLAAYARYSQSRSVIGAPSGAFPQSDRSLTVGVTIGLPLFNKNQGAKTEAELTVRQAQARREFAERVVRSEVLGAYERYESANRAIRTLETAALPLVAQNVETFRRVYELGEIKITDLINEQRRLLDANRDLTEAMTERYRARADIYTALGATGSSANEPK